MREPLHITLRKYRVAALIITAFFMFLTYDMWDWFKDNQGEMKEWAVAGFVSIILFAGGVVKWSLENITKKQEKDDHDEQ